MYHPPDIVLLTSPDWQTYELLDSGNGKKLERFGPYILSRPEVQALWRPALPIAKWKQAHAEFHSTGGEGSGAWEFRHPIPAEWPLEYKDIKFLVSASGSRHTGVFPEQANHWDWIESTIRSVGRPVEVLNLFGHTGLASLAAAHAGARVTHVDASKKSISVGHRNQELSGLTNRPIRWLVDDAFKFVQREVRRGKAYDGLILDPPKFGRGPQGQVWELFDSLNNLLMNCRKLLSQQPLFLIVTAYAIRASSLSIFQAIEEMLSGLDGTFEAGELVLVEKSAGRLLSTAIFTRWRSSTT